MTTSSNNTKKTVNYDDLALKLIKTTGPIAAVSLTVMSISLCIFSRLPQKLPTSATFTKNNITIQLEVAKTPRELSKGLQFRKSIPENTGMLFVVDRPEPIKLWMRNTYMPLDIIFLLNGVVNDIKFNVPPCNTPTDKLTILWHKLKQCPTYSGKLPADKIIEISAGTVKKLNIKIGEDINIAYLKHQT